MLYLHKSCMGMRGACRKCAGPARSLAKCEEQHSCVKMWPFFAFILKSLGKRKISTALWFSYLVSILWFYEVCLNSHDWNFMMTPGFCDYHSNLNWVKAEFVCLCMDTDRNYANTRVVPLTYNLGTKCSIMLPQSKKCHSKRKKNNRMRKKKSLPSYF